MNKTCNLLTALADPAFNLRAFADYTKAKTDAYTNINASIISSLELLPDLEGDDDVLVCPSDEEIDSYLLSKGVTPNSILLLNGGYTTPRALAKSLLQNQVQIENEVLTVPDVDIQLTDPLGTTVRSIDWTSAIDDLQSGLLAAESLQSGIEGMIAKVEGYDLASIASKMESKLQGKVDLTNVTVSSSMSYYKEVIASSMNENVFLQKILNITGVEDIADDVPLAAPMNSQVSAMTGASPAGPLDFSNVVQGAQTVLSIGSKVVKGLISAAISAGKKLYSKVEQKVTQIVTDPFDLYEVDGSDSTWSPIVANFGYVSSDEIIIDRLPARQYNETQVAGLVTMMNETFHNSLLISKFVFGELSINGGLFGYTHIDGNIIVPEHYVVKVNSTNYTFKPKPIRREFHDMIVSKIFASAQLVNPILGTGGVEHRFPSSYNDEDADAQIADIAQSVLNYGCKYYTVADNEVDLCNGFSYARNLLVFVMMAAVAEWDDDRCHLIEEDAQLENASPIAAQWIYDGLFNTSVTNLDFVKSVSGYNPSTNTFTTSPMTLKNSFKIYGDNEIFATYSPSLQDAVGNYLYVFWNMKRRQALAPVDYPYFPYRRDVEQFSQGRYAIKTDAENAEAFNNFMTTLVVAAIAVVVVVSCGVVAKKLAKSLWKKREASNASIQSKLWSGESLTSREWRKNRRYAKRAGTIASVTSPFPSSLKDTISGEIMSAAGLQPDTHSITDINAICGSIRASIAPIL